MVCGEVEPGGGWRHLVVGVWWSVMAGREVGGCCHEGGVRRGLQHEWRDGADDRITSIWWRRGCASGSGDGVGLLIISPAASGRHSRTAISVRSVRVEIYCMAGIVLGLTRCEDSPSRHYSVL